MTSNVSGDKIRLSCGFYLATVEIEHFSACSGCTQMYNHKPDVSAELRDLLLFR